MTISLQPDLSPSSSSFSLLVELSTSHGVCCCCSCLLLVGRLLAVRWGSCWLSERASKYSLVSSRRAAAKARHARDAL